MKVSVDLKYKTVEINDVHFYSFERNFLVVYVQSPKSKTYFKLSTILGVKETNETISN
jgi:hypothetical protein